MKRRRKSLQIKARHASVLEEKREERRARLCKTSIQFGVFVRYQAEMPPKLPLDGRVQLILKEVPNLAPVGNLQAWYGKKSSLIETTITCYTQGN